MPYRNLDATEIIATLRTLSVRIEERFPNAGLAAVCRELTLIAGETLVTVTRLAKPNLPIRAGVSAIIIAGIGAAVYGGVLLSQQERKTELFSLVSGLESFVNLILVVGTGVFLLTSAETRFKRHQAMKALHELRSIVHVIDMHQLTKDPAMIGGARTRASPDHALTPFELVRYLDYCSEMLSLAGKLVALYAQDFNDGDVVEAASDIEQLATNLSQKVWQKITIVQAARD